MTPEEKAEKWVKDKCYSEGTFELRYGYAGSEIDLNEIKSEIKQAYLAGYAEKEKELDQEYDDLIRIGKEILK